MKKHALTLIAAVTSTAMIIMPTTVFAKVAKGEPLTFPITIPSINSNYLFNIEGLYIEPTAAPFNANSYSYLGNSIEGTHYNDPIYQWAFKVGVGYIFNRTGNDLQFNWTHLKNDSDGSITVIGNTSHSSTGDSAVFFKGPTGTGSSYVLNSGDYANVNSSTTLKNDALDLELGQYVNFGSNLSTRWLIGARYAEISGNTESTLSGTEHNGESSAASFTEHATIKTKFNGIGPRLGLIANYMVYGGAGIIASGSGFLLAGKIKNSAQSDIAEVKTSNQSLTTQNNVAVNHFKSVVPGFDAKVGINYIKQTLSHDLSYINIEVGYQVTDYIDGLDSTLAYGTQQVDFEYRGPYLGLNLFFS